MKEEELLRIENVTKFFKTSTTWGKPLRVYAVNGVSFFIRKGETLGLVGESGCGKSTLGRTVIRLYVPDNGEIFFKGIDITHLSERKLRPYRKNMQIIFQDPFSSLNPRIRVGKAIEEPLVIHHIERDPVKRKEIVISLLQQVGLQADDYYRYPHEFSGGGRQRIAIARAIALKPQLVVADEAVSALDVSIQAQVLNLLLDLQKKYNLSYLFISHDLRVVSKISDRVAVMYLGKIMEIGRVKDVFEKPYHPYSHALLSAVPGEEIPHGIVEVKLEGDPPGPYSPPKGCPLAQRCPFATDECFKIEPPLEDVGNDHHVACHHPLNV